MPNQNYPRNARSTCPHECPSTCALEVELLDADTLGAIRGARDNSYTKGVICAKVARYAERLHHADRLGQPLWRRGGKGLGGGAFEPISWQQAPNAAFIEGLGVNALVSAEPGLPNGGATFHDTDVWIKKLLN